MYFVVKTSSIFLRPPQTVRVGSGAPRPRNTVNSPLNTVDRPALPHRPLRQQHGLQLDQRTPGHRRRDRARARGSGTGCRSWMRPFRREGIDSHIAIFCELSSTPRMEIGEPGDRPACSQRVARIQRVRAPGGARSIDTVRAKLTQRCDRRNCGQLPVAPPRPDGRRLCPGAGDGAARLQARSTATFPCMTHSRPWKSPLKGGRGLGQVSGRS